MSYLFLQADAGKIPLPSNSVDLVIGSPPYQMARSYGINAGRKCEAWIEFMLDVTAEAVRVSRGLVLWVIGGSTKNWCYQPGPEGLLYRWWSEGVGSGVYHDGLELPRRRPVECAIWRPVTWRKVGIAGSGGRQWFRSDTEYVMAFLGKAGPIPWADNTACGHPPKWGPGGEMSHRVSDGTRVNQWGKTGTDTGTVQLEGGVVRHGKARPSHVSAKIEEYKKDHTKREPDGSMRVQHYYPPKLANPGNVLDVKVGGGLMGSKWAHENEAPYPIGVPEFFIKSCCPPGGLVLDPFSGSGTTSDAAERNGRHSIGMDLRMNQCELAYRRMAEPPPPPKKAKKTRQPRSRTRAPLAAQMNIPFPEAS